MQPSSLRLAIDQLEALSGRDVAQRGLGPLSRLARGGLWGAASSIAAHPTPRVVLLTGFYVARAQPPAAESDGPVGVAHLARALERVGVDVRVVTDTLCEPVVAAALQAAGSDAPVIAVPIGAAGEVKIAQLRTRWREDRTDFTHLIAIERVGPAADGVLRSCRGDSLDEHSVSFASWFEDKGEATTIGIGDGGNELGMGNIPTATVAEGVPHGAAIACRTRCDHLIVSGVSNWGAATLLGALALVKPEWREALLAGVDATADRRILSAVIEAGGVDGMVGSPQLSVDGLSAEQHSALITEMREIVDGVQA